MKHIATIVIAAGLILASCATASKHADNVCPEHAGLKCLTEVICDLDEERGCSVCYCSNAASDSESVNSYDTGIYSDEKGGP